MDCKFSKIKICQLKNSTFQSQLLNFGDFDISGYAFTAIFMSNKIKQSQQLIPIGNTLEIPFSILESEFGNTRVELWWEKDGINDIVVAFDMKIVSENCEECGNKTQHDVIVEINEGQNQIPVSVTQSIVNNLLDFDNLTEAQKAELKGSKGDAFVYSDFTPEQLEDLKGKDGYTPIKGVDYNDGYTPIKGVDYFDGKKGEDGYTPVKGVDYFDGYTPIKGIDYFDGEKGDNGWTAIHTFESDGAQRQIKKLTDYIGGTGDKPTQNIGQYVLENGYTTDKSLATNFKGDQNDNLIAEYVHSGNLEVVVSSINYTTNTLTSLNHGLVNGDRVAFNITNDCNVLTQTPFSQMWTADSSGGGYFVANATQDTFQLTLSNGGAVMTLNNRVGNNFTKWWIERNSPNGFIEFNNLDIKSLRCRILGGCHRIMRYVLNNQNVYTGYKKTEVAAIVVADKGALYGSIETDVDIVNSCDLINVNLKLIGLNNSSAILDYFTDNILIKPNRTFPITTIPSLKLMHIKPFNGTLIQILKK